MFVVNKAQTPDFSTWQGWLYVAFVIDLFARRIMGWRVTAPPMRTDFVLDALESEKNNFKLASNKTNREVTPVLAFFTNEPGTTGHY